MRWLYAFIALGVLVILTLSLVNRPQAAPAGGAQAVQFNCDVNPAGPTPGANTVQPGSFFSTDPAVTAPSANPAMPALTSCVHTNQNLLRRGYRLGDVEFIDDSDEMMFQLWLRDGRRDRRDDD
jgi:hypothetical protein